MEIGRFSPSRWRRVGRDWENNGAVFAALHHRRPGFGAIV